VNTAGTISRPNAIRLVIFNHKGGVGKTTLTVNIAAEVAALGKRVLLVDSDPQCNLTSYLIEDRVVDDLLDHSDSPDGRTVWSALKPIVEADGNVRQIRPFETSLDNVFLVPGDIRLSEYEAELNEFLGQCLQRKAKGFRGATALSLLVSHLARHLSIDYVFYDSGPNIGPLNRVVLLDCDCFIVPVACDLFSVRALKTLGRTLSGWIGEWKTISGLAPPSTYLLPGTPRFLGYIPQGFRIYRGKLATHHSAYLAKIDRHIQSDIVAVMRTTDPELASGSLSRFKLGQVKDFASLVPASQTQGVPLSIVTAGTEQQHTDARSTFHSLAKTIITRTQSK